MEETTIAVPGLVSGFGDLPLSAKKVIAADLAAERDRAMKRYRGVIEDLRLESRKSKEASELYRRMVGQLGVDELTHLDLVTIAGTHRWRIEHGDSFFRNIIQRRRLRQLGAIPEKHLGQKNGDLELARSLGVAVPRGLWSGLLDDVPAQLRVNSFLKPTWSIWFERSL